MSCRTIGAISALILLVSASSVLIAAPKPRVPVKTKTPPRVVLGTKQLAGDQAVPGQEYTLGKSAPINFKLNSVEYSARRIRIGDDVYLPAATEKHLVIHYTVHNPEPREHLVRFDTLRFTAVDDKDTNQNSRQFAAVEATGDTMNLRLKPGQKLDGYTFLTIPAAVSIPKLMVQAGPDSEVLRYDLRGKIKPLTGPCVDPADNSGAKALADVPASVGDTYEMGLYDVTLVSAAYSDQAMDKQRLRSGERNLVLSLKIRNGTRRQQLVRFDTVRVQCSDADGADIAWRGNLLAGSRDADFNARLEPGQEVSVRTYAVVAKGQQAKTLVLSSGAGNRRFVYDISQVR